MSNEHKKNKYDVAVILIGLNAKQFVIECIQSIIDATWREVTFEIIYIDNASTDGSVEALTKLYHDKAQIISNDTNVGFCKAANQGARLANSDYYYFINDDTLVIDDAIAITVEYMNHHPDVGTIGSRLIYPDGEEQYSGRMFPNIYSSFLGRRSFLTKYFSNIKVVSDYLCKNELHKNEPFEVDWVSAAGQIIEKEDFNRVGGFAEDYYYWHEAVFCHRLSQKGKKIILDPRSKIIHYEGKGSGPRSIKVQKFHILDFHKGAFRAYCERYNLSLLSPTRYIVGAALSARAMLLLSIAYFRNSFNSSSS